MEGRDAVIEHYKQYTFTICNKNMSEQDFLAFYSQL